MKVRILPYLQSHLDVADALPERWPELPAEDVERIQARLRELVQLVAIRDAQVIKLTRALEEAQQALAR